MCACVRAFTCRHDFINEYDVDGCPAIYYALEAYQLEILTLLIDYGADVNARNDKRYARTHVQAVTNTRTRGYVYVYIDASSAVVCTLCEESCSR